MTVLHPNPMIALPFTPIRLFSPWTLRICLFCLGMQGGLSARESPPATAVEVTGVRRTVNGADEIPRGLFGTHAVPLTPERVESWGIEIDRTIDHTPSGTPRTAVTPMLLECIFDRYQPALLLTDPDWKSRLESIARRYAAEAKTLDRKAILEFWNEPYLNWAANPGVNYDGGHYLGPPEAGRPMRTRIGGEPIENLVWDRPRLIAVRDFNPGRGSIDYLATRYQPEDLKEGDRFTWRNNPYLAQSRWWGKDITQPVSWWSGEVNREFYHRMLEPFARALKDANPEVQLVAGWGFHLNEGNWKAWDILHRPLIDFAHEWIDGYNEHHYGGNTRGVAGTYETVYAYTLAAHGKKLKFFNTEAGGMVDPERPGSFTPAVTGSPVQQARGAYTYMLRDVLHLIDTMPDKAVTRFTHHAHHHKGGSESAFKLLKPLRGRLMEAVVPDDPNVWAVAGLEGTRYTAVVFNDHYRTRDLKVTIRPPPGYSFAGGSLAKAVEIPDTGLDLEQKELNLNSGSSLYQQTLTLAGKDAARYRFELRKQNGAPLPVRHLRQFPAPEILQTVRPDQPARFTVTLPRLPDPDGVRARLRLVHESDLRWRPEDLKLTVNGNAVPLNVSTDYLYEMHIPFSLLQQKNEIRFSLSPEAKAVRICTVSLFLEKLQHESHTPSP